MRFLVATSLTLRLMYRTFGSDLEEMPRAGIVGMGAERMSLFLAWLDKLCGQTKITTLSYVSWLIFFTTIFICFKLFYLTGVMFEKMSALLFVDWDI